MIKRRKRTNKCVSCRRLKISCNEDKPSCDYCVSTNRECVYEPLVSVPTPKPVVKRKSTRKLKYSLDNGPTTNPSNSISESVGDSLVVSETSRGAIGREEDFLLDNLHPQNNDIINTQLALATSDFNSMTYQLGMTRFELRLTKFFSSYFLDKRIEIHQLDEGLRSRIISKWNSNKTLQNIIYGISTMLLYKECDVSKILTEDKEVDSKMNADFRIITNNNRLDLYLKSLNYFQEMIKLMQQKIDELIHSDNNFGSLEDGIEHVIISILMFLFILMEPFKLVPLISFDNEPDVLVFCAGISHSIFPISEKLMFLTHDRKNLAKYKDIMLIFQDDLSHKEVNYPLTRQLLGDFHSCRIADGFKIFPGEESELSMNDIHHAYLLPIYRLDVCIDKVMKLNNSTYLFRWIFLMTKVSYNRMKEKDFFGLKLLFIYCCVCLWCGIDYYNKNDSNPLVDYVLFYKKHNFDTYGEWKQPSDKFYYELTIDQQFVFPNYSFDILNHFTPESYSV
ncbi:hypothetical protein CLIB1444_14S01662 [[Candida] jaroonii]|uniref:Uncharacterized protein n=1 Tax=[Candida] jaroonii TaxID=467808 RepID=A0ACA9YFU9_9ASCO|nr:hypothetical protein CLIB1444_14S01662 [[Candida] jaroonii]